MLQTNTTSLTFGRFNIPHTGHVNLIFRMLSVSDYARVYLSTGKNNNCWFQREQLLRELCRLKGVDMARVTFLRARSPVQALKDTLENCESEQVTLVLGSDRKDMGISFSQEYSIRYLEHPRVFSSTQVRDWVDSERERELSTIYFNNSHIVNLAKHLRQEELRNEKSRKAQVQTQSFTTEVQRSEDHFTFPMGRENL